MDLWYNKYDKIPFKLHIQLSDFIQTICQTRKSQKSTVIEQTTILSYDNNRAIYNSKMDQFKEPNPTKYVNMFFNMKGSFEDYFDIIDLIARIKIFDNPKNKHIPEFYISSTALSIKHLKRLPYACDSYTNPSTPPNPNILISNDKTAVDASTGTTIVNKDFIYWGLFYYQKAIATFRIHNTNRTIHITPIFDYDRFEIINYIVY